MNETLTTTCENHPNRPTALRCNRCEKYICSKCAVHTPTGYRCKDCVRGHQRIFETARWYDYLSGFALAGFLSWLGSLILPRLGFFVLILGPMAGVAIAEAVRFVTGRRRAKALFLTIAAGAALGAAPAILADIGAFFTFIAGQAFAMNFLFNIIWQGIYLVMVTTTVYSRVAGLFLRQ